jgi:hypothetical protein
MTPDRFLIGNGRWCSTCFPDGSPMNWDWKVPVGRGRRGIRRGCNECAGSGRIAFTPQEIVDATVAEVRAVKDKNKEAQR